MNNYELTNYIKEHRPNVELDLINANVVKLRELAKALKKREQEYRLYFKDGQWVDRARKLFYHAGKLAFEIDCSFSGVKDSNSDEWIFSLHCDEHSELLA